MSKPVSKQGSIEPDVSELLPYCPEQKKRNPLQRFVDGFKREIPGEKCAASENKVLTRRHLTVLSLSSGLGTGLLVASASKLASGGPLSLLVGYFIIGYLMLFPTMYLCGELAIAYSNSPGGFNDYYRKFMDESMAFALGWNYCFQWITVISLELVTASLTIKFWNDTINPDAFVTIFLATVIAINLCGARGYGEAEFVMNSIKLLMLSGFIIFGLCVDLGASKLGYIGGKYWRDPGYFTNFKGLASVFVTGAFSLGGTEFICLFVSLQPNPRKSLKSAVKLVFYRITVFFLGSLVFVGLLVPHNSDRLMGTGGSSASHASPYVLSAELHGVKVLPHIINAVILNSVTSVATAAMYSSTQLLYSLMKQGYAPKFLDYVDRSGRPTICFLIVTASSFFAYIATYKKEETVFNWLLSISALCFMFVWLAICICHIRFRAALKYNNIPLSSLAFVSPFGVWGSYLSILINFLILIAQFWVALFPKGGKANANSFFQNYLGVPFILVCYAGHKIYSKNWQFMIPIKDIDIDEGRTIYDPEVLELERLEEKESYKKAPFWKKALIVCFD